MDWYIFLLLSAFFIALAELLEKKALYTVHATEMLGMRGVFSIIILLIVAPFADWNVPVMAVLTSMIVGIMLTFGFLYKLKATRHLEISTTAPMMNFSPIFLVVLAAVLLGEYPTLLQGFGVLLILCGAYAIQVTSYKNLLAPIKETLRSRHMQYVVFVVFTFAVTATLDRFVLTQYAITPLTYLITTGMTIAVLSVIIDIYNYGTKDIVQDLKTKKLMFFSISALILLSGFFFMQGISMPGALIALAIPIKRLSTLLVTVIGGNIFHETDVTRKTVSCLIMVAGAILIIM